MTSQSTSEFNALPDDWASDPALIAGLRVDDDDEHDDPVLRWPDGRVVDTWREGRPPNSARASSSGGSTRSGSGS